MKSIRKYRLITYISAIFFIAVIVAANTISVEAQSNGLVAWYQAEGTATDSVGGNNGTLQNVAFTSGHSGQAFRFGTGYIEVPNSPSLELQQLSVAAWVRSQSPGFYNYLLSMGSSNCNGYGAFQLQTDNTGGLRFGIGTFSGAQSPDAGQGIWDGNWHYVVGTYNGAFVRLFVDGNEVGSGTPLPNHQINYNTLVTNNLIIGDFNPLCGSFKFQGDIDDLKIYNRALTASEIAQQNNTYQVGNHPTGLTFDGFNVWVANRDDNSVTKIRASDGLNLGTFAVGYHPSSLAFDGANIWVSNRDGNSVMKLRASDGVILQTIPMPRQTVGLVFDGANIWVANYDEGTVTKLRASDGANLGVFPSGNTPAGLTFDGANIWVANNQGAGFVTKLRASDGVILGTFYVQGFPGAIAFDGSSIWVANTGNWTMTKLRASDGFEQGVFFVGPNMEGMTFDGASIWVVNESSLFKFRACDGTLLGTFSGVSTGTGVTFDGANIWVANYGANTVAKYAAGTTNPCQSATNIDPQAFTGNYRVYNTDTNTFVGAFTGTQMLNLAAGNYLFDNGNGVGGSAFNFSVNQFGQVTSVSNPNAAEAIGNTLRLKNAVININPQAYTGRYIFGSFNTLFSGAQTFTVIPGLRYAIDNGTSRGGALRRSYFYIDIGANGEVSNTDLPAAAYGSGNTLVFNNTTLTVEPNDYTGNYNITSYGAAAFVSGRQSFVLIPGLLYGFDNGAGFYEPTFNLNAGGQIDYLDPSGFAGGLGNVLSLANVRVHVDPTNYGGNYLLNGQLLSGIQEKVLIPTMRFYVAVNNSYQYAVPTPTAVTPPSVTLNNGAQTFNFYIVQPVPLQLPGLLSWWRAEGNALDSIGTNHGTLQNGAIFTAGKLGQAFNFDGVNNQYVLVPDADNLDNFSAATISAWIRLNTTSGSQAIVSKVPVGEYILFVKNGKLNFENNRICFDCFQGNTTLQPNVWYHVAATYDGDKTRLYVNGQLDGVNDVDWNFPNSASFKIGARQDSDRSFNGQIDEVQIYNRPLSDCELRNLYNSANGLPLEICDNVAPTTNSARNPNANPAGWNNSNVNVSLSATDNLSGSGVNQITYSASGAQIIPPTTVNGSTTNLTITAEGETIVSYFARDNAGNTEEVKTLTVKIDKTAPLITSTATVGGNPYTAGTWTNQNVAVSFDCTDSGSGVENVTQPVTLSNEGTNQSANGVCTDAAGNNASTSFANVKIDKTAPTISVTAPTGGNYLLNQAVTVSFTCTDSLSGISSCTGTSANGGLLNTASPGAKTFTVNASDNAGNSASPTTVNYTVNFGLAVLFDQTKAHKSGSTVPIKIRLVDANGANVSSAGTVVHAVSVVQVGSQASPVLEDAGNSNPDFDFRYDPGLGGYIFNLKTTGYGTGTYQLNFIAGNTATIYSVQFQVRQ